MTMVYHPLSVIDVSGDKIIFNIALVLQDE